MNAEVVPTGVDLGPEQRSVVELFHASVLREKIAPNALGV